MVSAQGSKLKFLQDFQSTTRPAFFMNSGILKKSIPLDPVTKECSRVPVNKFSWVKKIFLVFYYYFISLIFNILIKDDSIRAKVQGILIKLIGLFFKKLLDLTIFLLKFIKDCHQYYQLRKFKNHKKIEDFENLASQGSQRRKNKVTHVITGCLHWFTGTRSSSNKDDEDIRIGDLLTNGLGTTFQKDLCKNWKEDNLWCMTKYKPVDKKVRPVNQPMPQSINPPLQRPPLSRDPYKTPLTPWPPDFQPTAKITEERLGVVNFGPEGWLLPEEVKLFRHLIIL